MARILIDLDAICADLLTPWLAAINAKTGESLTVQDITNWDMHTVSTGGQDVYPLLDEPGLFRNLKPIPGALQAVEWLNHKYEVKIVTAGSGRPHNYAEKAEWVHEHLPFIKKRQLVMLHDKWLIPAEVLIDDKPETAVKFREANPYARILSIEYPYNSACPAYDLLCSWEDPSKAWLAMYDFITSKV